MNSSQSNSIRNDFKNIKPGHGHVFFEHDTKKERKSKTEEYREAKILLKEIGGEFIILRESREQGVSTPDMSRDSTEYIEVKHPDSLVALDTRLRQGIAQLLFEKNRIENYTLKVLILILGKKLRHVNDNKVVDIVNRRLREIWKCEVDLIIIRNGARRFEIWP